MIRYIRSVAVVAKHDDKSALGKSGNRGEKIILKWTPRSNAKVAVWCLCEGRKWNGIP